MVSAATAALAVAGVVAIVFGLLSQDVAPSPEDRGGQQPAAAPAGTPTEAVPAPPSATRDSAPAKQARSGPVLPASQPTSIKIPSIDVRSSLITVGRNPDGSMEVPQPGPNYDKAAWYKYSPTPGEVGPSVIIGHIDSAEKGPSVFYRLGATEPGDKVSVERADGTVAVFTVDRVEEYPKDDFPTLEVYGNTENPELRLITCGGPYDASAGNYLHNIVVYAHLTGVR